MKAMTLIVLHAQTFKPVSPVTILCTEVVMIQTYAEVSDKEIPELKNEATDEMLPATVIRGTPAHTVITLQSGLQFRVAEDKLYILTHLGWEL